MTITYNQRGSKKELVTILLEEPLLKGHTYELFMEFNGTMQKKQSWGVFCKPYKVGRKIE